jgi:hypothetical protein
MTSHLGFMALFAASVSAVFATLTKDAARDQLRLGLRLFGGLVVSAYLIGWILYGLFG